MNLKPIKICLFYSVTLRLLCTIRIVYLVIYCLSTLWSNWGLIIQNYFVERSKEGFVSSMPVLDRVSQLLMIFVHAIKGLLVFFSIDCHIMDHLFYSHFIPVYKVEQQNQTFPTQTLHGNFSLSLPEVHAKATVKSMTPKVSLRNVFYYLLSFPFPSPIFQYNFL